MNAAPPLAGLTSYQAAAVHGYDVERTVALIKRYAYVEQQTVLCLAAHLNAVPEWEVKCAISLHLWQDAEHCTWLRDRVAELRNFPLRLDRVPEPALGALFPGNAAFQRAFEEASRRYTQLVDEDRALPRARWWDDFYRRLKESRPRDTAVTAEP